MQVDLHCHSTASDGTEAPAEVVRRARAAGLDVVALTDHDTTAGHAEARAHLPEGLTLIAGAEISCVLDGLPVHLLGYLFDPADPALDTELRRIRTDRDRRARAMVAKLNELGVAVTAERVFELAQGGAVGRPHLARAMVEAGAVGDVPEAFTSDWIGDGGRAYVEKHALDPTIAIELVHNAGGKAVLAHPGAAKRGRTLADDDIVRLAEHGLAGLEVDHPDHDEPTRTRLRALARDLGLLATGSSDDHGELTGHRLGCETTDPAVYEALITT